MADFGLLVAAAGGCGVASSAAVARMPCTFTALCVKSGFGVMRDVMRHVMRRTFKYLVVCKSTSCIANLVCISTSMVLVHTSTIIFNLFGLHFYNAVAD